MDSLVLDRLPTREDTRQMLAELCRGAEDIDPILHSFKNSLHLRVGVRDVLGKEDIRATTAALADVAEVCLQQFTLREYHRMVEKYGYPSRAPAAEDEIASNVDPSSTRRSAGNGQTNAAVGDDAPCELVILAMGKLGGREPNYHSDLDIIFIYEHEGITRRLGRARSGETTTNQHFFSEMGQRIIKAVSRLGPYGRLYELDPRLRPTGKSGSLAVSIAEFSRYFSEGQGQLWERQALCRARPIHGSPAACEAVMKAVRDVIVDRPWAAQDAQEICQMRQRMQESASAQNLKRGPGGTVDVEFTVQMLQLRHAAKSPSLLVTGTLDALEALREAGHLSGEDFEFLSQSYRFLRSVEARLRLMNTTARHDLPEDPGELEKLAYLLGTTCESLVADCRRYTDGNRRVFERIFAAASP
jgi:glutamate-ammonia-ligase adenylyltransferase